MLWFDVESRYKATLAAELAEEDMLWFDVESRYKATLVPNIPRPSGCGLM